MRFNNFTINNGDSKNSIIDKINRNFSQIISFSGGPKGRDGESGPTGYPGSAGPRGLTGTTGTRASEWVNSTSEPLSANDYDLWINQSLTGNSDVYSYDSGWTATGLSLVDSEFFSVKNSIPTFTTETDYSAIYFSGDDQPNQYLVISDSNQDSSIINPNYSKLLVSTSDQTDRPIFSFRKSNVSGSGAPSFYWGSTGQNSPLKFQSNYSLKISAIGSFFFPKNDVDSILFPPNPATGDAYLRGRNLYSNTWSLVFYGYQSWSTPANFNINFGGSRPFVLSQSELDFGIGFRNYGSFTSSPLASLSQPEGVVISRGQTASADLARFQHSVTSGLSGLKNILTIRQNTLLNGSVQSVGGSMVVGGTSGFNIYSGGNIDSPTGPFAYHTVGISSITKPFQGSFPIGSATRYYIDVTNPLNYYKDYLFVSVPPIWNGANRIYIKIPKAPATPPSANYYPLWGTTYCSEYRIMLNYGSSSSKNRQIYGVVWDQLKYGVNTSSPGYNTNQYVDFVSPCYFFDLIYYYNSEIGQVYAYIKTCNGQSIPIAITKYTGALAPDRLR